MKSAFAYMLALFVIGAMLIQGCTSNPDQLTNNTKPPQPQELTVAVNSPVKDAVFQQDDLITFNGSATLGNEQLTGEQLVWTSDKDGIIGVGNGFNRSGLSAGEHLITLTATAATGEQASKTVRINNQAQNNRIQVFIHSPAGKRIKPFDLLKLNGSAVMPDGTPITDPLAFEWRSNLEDNPSPILGDGPQIEPGGLKAGLHTITLNVTADDGQGNTISGSAQIEVTVEFVNNNINLDVLAPQSGFQLSTGQELTCIGSASLNGDNSFREIIWTSSIDDTIGYTTTCIVPSLSPGTHRITMTAATTDNKKAATSIIVEVTE